MLKANYIPPPERRRIDEVVLILANQVESHYQWVHTQVEQGFQNQTLNQFQKRSKALADGYTEDFIKLLGIRYFRAQNLVSCVFAIVPFQWLPLLMGEP